MFFRCGRGILRCQPGNCTGPAFGAGMVFWRKREPSIVRLELKKDGNRGTVVRLLHTHIPAEVFEEITEGWKEYYLGSVKNMLEVY